VLLAGYEIVAKCGAHALKRNSGEHMCACAVHNEAKTRLIATLCERPSDSNVPRITGPLDCFVVRRSLH
jgi:hypothetical protein